MYWFILLIPLFVAWFAKFKFHSTITWKEMGLQMVISIIIVALILVAGTYSKTADTEIWNGRVTKKAPIHVSCEHSYDCMCVDVSTGNKGETMRVCQTCYEHSYDIDWRVYTTIDDFNIRRIDSQGVKEPPRFKNVVIGEPYAKEKMYTNYIKAVPESIFGEIKNTHPLIGLVPKYPEVYDYYRINRVQTVGLSIKDVNKWNSELSNVAKDLGASYEVNPIIQFVKTDDPTYQFALEQKWLTGKKNDVIIVFGVKNYPKIDFVRIVGWENEELKHRLRTSLELFDTIDDEYRKYAIGSIKQNIILYFNRMKMVDYEYLKDQIDPMWVIVLGFVVAVFLSVGLTWYFHKNDVFGDEKYNSRMYTKLKLFGNSVRKRKK